MSNRSAGEKLVNASSRNKGLRFRSGIRCNEVAPFVGRGAAEAARHEAGRRAAAACSIGGKSRRRD